MLTRVEAQGLEEVVPCVLVVSQRRTEIKAGQRRSVERQLYPGYVMVQIRTNDDGSIPAEVLHLVRETPGPINFAGTAEKRDRPEPMSPDEVAKLMRQLEACSADDAPVSVEFEKGQHVRVREGAFAGLDGTVDAVNPEKGLVKVIVSVFGRPTAIDFDYWKIERAEA